MWEERDATEAEEDVTFLPSTSHILDSINTGHWLLENILLLPVIAQICSAFSHSIFHFCNLFAVSLDSVHIPIYI